MQQSRTKRAAVAAVAAGLIAGIGASSPAAAGGTFPHVGAISTANGPATPYPATISVSGQVGVIVDVDVVLDNVSHTNPDDLDIRLDGPDGTSIVLLSDVGGTVDVVGVDLRLDQDTTATPSDLGPLTSGTYHPRNADDGNGAGLFDSYPAPAPSAPSDPDGLDAFIGKPANGTWRLYVVDDTSQDAGTIGSWSLVIETFVPALPGGDDGDPADPDACGSAPEDGFADVAAGSTHEANIDCIVSYGIATGFDDGTYRPALQTSRAQMASFVARTMEAAGTALPAAPTDAFVDDEGSPHEPRIDQLSAVGVIGGNGESAGNYFPAGAMRRDHMASFLARAYEVTAGQTLPPGPDAFTDDEGSPYEAAIDALAAADVLSGTGSGLYNPAGTVTRGQMASFLARFLDLLADEGILA